jgi:hypothetical protein
MKRLTALVLIAAALSGGASAGDYMPDCPQYDNHGRLLFSASERANGALVCRYAPEPETPPCPYTSTRGDVNMQTKTKPSGVIVCVYGGAGQ